MLSCKRSRELWTEGVSRQRAGDMGSRRMVGFAGLLWARTRVGGNGGQLRV